MARTANPDKPKIDALRAEGKIHLHAIKEGVKAYKKLLSVNAKLVKFEAAEIPVPETAAAAPTKAAAKPVAKATEKPVAKKGAKVEEKTKFAKGKAAAKSVTTAPKKRGRPSKADTGDLEFD